MCPFAEKEPRVDPAEAYSERENAYMSVAIRPQIADLRAEFRAVSDW